MQFSYNSDHPGIDSATGVPRTDVIAQHPEEFPPVEPIPCAKITTRVYHPQRNEIVTVQNVLVRTAAQSPGTLLSVLSGNNNIQSNQQSINRRRLNVDDDSIMSSSSSSSSSFSDVDDDSDGGMNNSLDQQQGGVDDSVVVDEYAYWTQRTIREAIYGRVLFAVILRKRRKTEHIPLHQQQPAGAGIAIPDWIVTDKFCAVKEMSWQHMRKERDRLAEDPIKEVAAMQYFKAFRKVQQQQQLQQVILMEQQQQQFASSPTIPTQFAINKVADPVTDSFQMMSDTNVMIPLDLLTDERYLYSVMPYCDGGELFERLDLNEQFTEDEARFWMIQILNGLENLQHAGICHRDISLENLLVHNENGALIIDMGMCLLLPFVESATSGINTAQVNPIAANLATSFGNLNMQNQQSLNTVPVANNNSLLPLGVSRRYQPRCLVKAQGTCGKWIYMSPEILLNKEPFDGYTVDMWAAGVILFLMLTGFPPWERADLTDERFKYMAGGYLVQMLTEWEVGLSSDALDLLQRMLFYDPKDRLSLDQVRAHPWMARGISPT